MLLCNKVNLMQNPLFEDDDTETKSVTEEYREAKDLLIGERGPFAGWIITRPDFPPLPRTQFT